MFINLLTTLGHCTPVHHPELPPWQQILLYVLWGAAVVAAGGLIVAFVRRARQRRNPMTKGDDHAS